MKKFTPFESFSKLYRKQTIDASAFATFSGALKELFKKIKDKQREPTQRKFFTTFIEKIIPNGYLVTHEEDGIDFVVHTGEGTNSPKGVLIELKSTTNKDEMVTTEEINRKALQELLYYYLNERIDKQNISLKYLIACNTNECFLWDAQVFENAFAKNKPLLTEYDDFKNGRLGFTRRDKFYEEIAKRYIEEVKDSLDFTYINIRDCYKKYQRNNEKALTPLFKLFNVTFLMKIPVKNDSNELDRDFYRELLYIMGIEEWLKENGDIHRIRRIKSGAQKFSLMEQIWSRLDDYNITNDEERFEIAMGLLITWINRILFLKLLESQLISFKKEEDVKFLTSEHIPDYDVLHDLFMKVLAKPISERDEEIKERFPSVPYLNSSLFEISPLEKKYFSIGMLRLGEMDIYSKTVLKNSRGSRQTGRMSVLTYLLSFLDAYDFGSSEIINGIKKEKKTLINASVLGLIFEKINGYKDGSFFTPGYITEYICNKTIRRAVIDKFNEAKGWECANFDELKEKINGGRREVRNDANEIINSLKICDPAVGSGHFLVSALNEIIAIKSDLGVLQDRKPTSKPIREYEVKVEFDELVVVDEDGDTFRYKPSEPASQRIQETLFEEKRTIIENCLFGVDLNPKSVEICRLRLWIELLKNAYYYQADNGERYLQTLPNIDINIKCGNSLAANYLLNAKLNSSASIQRYKKAVAEYKQTSNKEKKYDIDYNISVIKSTIKLGLQSTDKEYKAFVKLEDRYLQLTETFSEDMFGYTQKQIKARNSEIKRLKKEIEQRRAKLEEKKANTDFSSINAFEWRFEFPEVLDDEGNFLGFDCVIGNPPYISLENLPMEVSVYNRMHKPSEHSTLTEPIYDTIKAHGDIYTIFVERGLHILRKGGHLSYIIPNKWEKVMYGQPLRELFLRKNLTQLIDFCDNQIFEDATTYTCIIRMKNEKNKGSLQVSTIHNLRKEMLAQDVEERKEEFDTTQMNDEIWVTSSLLHFNLIRKFRQEMKPLFMYDGMASYRGILSGLSTAFNISVNKANELIAQDIRSNDILRPFLQGRGLVAYGKAEAGSYLVFIPKGFTALRMGIDRRTQPLPSEEEAWGWFCANYKAVAEWLLQFKSEASARRDKGDYWWELRACTYYDKFEMPKIFYQVFQVKPCFVYDESSTFCNNSMWFITVPDKALLALLCSKVGWWLISEHCPRIQNGYQLIWENFSSIPVPKQLPEVLSEYADRMMKVRNDEAAFNTLSNEVDKIVSGLYGITNI